MSEVNVTIFDRNYRLAVTTGEEKMLEDCARQVNEPLLAVRAAGRVIAIDQIAVLTALELAYDAKKREHDAKKTAAAPPQPVQQHFSIGAGQSEPEPLIARLQLDSAVGVSFQKAQRIKALHPAKLLYGGDRLGQHDSFSGHGLILPS